MDKRGIMLAMLAAGGEKFKFTPIQIHNSLFLMDRHGAQYMGGEVFDFIPYHYGPLDQEIYRLVNELVREGLVEKQVHGQFSKFSLTPDGFAEGTKKIKELPPKAASYLRRVVEWVKPLEITEVVSAIYQNYPDMQSYGYGDARK